MSGTIVREVQNPGPAERVVWVEGNTLAAKWDAGTFSLKCEDMDRIATSRRTGWC